MNECSILWCGKYHQNWENELHCHNYFQMVGILSGSGTVYVDDQPYEIEKEQVFLLCPQQLHAIHCGEKNAQRADGCRGNCGQREDQAGR